MKQILHKLTILIILLVGIVNYTFADKYGLIINGSGENNHGRYWNDCSVVYRTLRNMGYETFHIYVAISEGNIDDYIGPEWDLDRDGDGEIVYPANLDYLQEIFTWLTNRMTGDDDLFIYVTGPGSRNSITGHSYIKLLDGDSISDAEFAHMLETLQYRTINVVMQQSYAGGFVDELIALDNIVITTACQAGEESHSMARNYFDEFTFRWVSAITGDSPYLIINSDACDAPNPNQFSDIADCFIANDGDANGDNYVTMQEAFNYVELYNHANELPRIESNPGCLSRALALNELLYSDDCSPLLIDGWDLYMRDNSDDDGLEPNLSTNEHWLTPDIWFERNGQKVDKLQSGQTYDICVRVYNRGAQTSPAGAVLYTHWTKSRIGGSWPWGWNGFTYNCNGTPVLQGDLAGYVVLPQIDGGQTYIARIPWTTPLSEEYSPCFESLGAERNELWHYCVLARIVDSQEQPDETITDMSLSDFVLNFNNVVSRNVTILKAHNNYPSIISTGVVGLANPIYEENSGPYSLKFDIDGIYDLSHFADITLTFPTTFLNSQTNMTWQNCGFNSLTEKFYLADSARFDNINFTSNDDNFYPLVFDIEYHEFNPNLYYEYDINLTLEDASGVLVGGEKFEFHNYPQGMMNSILPRDIPVEEGSVIEKQKPIVPEDILYVDVYNAQGQLLMRTTNDKVESLNLPQGIYILRKIGTEMSYSVKIVK